MKVSKKLSVGEIPEWPNGTDCKSVARASKVRILLSPQRDCGLRINFKNADCGFLIAYSVRVQDNKKAEVAHLVERQPSKLRVAGSSPVFRSRVMVLLYAGSLLFKN